MNTFSKSFTRKFAVIILLFIGLAVLFIISIAIGSVKVSMADIFNAFFHPDKSLKQYQIIFYSRLPRSVAAVLAGGALAVAGAILQSILQNPLASPGIIGINAGAGVAVVAASLLFPGAAQAIPVAAFAGAFAAAVTVYFIAEKTGASKMTIVLAGVAVSSFIGAITDTLITLFPDVQLSRSAFSIGGFSGVSMQKIGLNAIYIPLCLLLSWLFSYDLNVLSLGGETASSVGLKSKNVRLGYIILAAILAGGAVSIAGLISFVGLIAPHVTRLLVGADNRFLIPASALFGSSFTLLCDILARSLFAPYELPVGIILSFLGAPFFIWLLFRQRRRKV